MYDELKKLSSSGLYPFHMPGHKRQDISGGELNPYLFDITEIEGFDDMHSPRGMIRDLNERLKDRFGGDSARILVNGSTSGVLTAVSASVKFGGKLIMASNSHRSAFNAAFLRNLTIVPLEPERIPEPGMDGGISPGRVEELLKEDPDAEAVYITSPTYEGVISDVESIASICHSFGVPLIVDSAHGAIAGLYEPFTEEGRFYEPISKGADIAVKSLHKTLPVFTQTSLIAVSGDRVDREELKRFYSIYQTSSPSYIFMAAADRMLSFLEERGEELFRRLGKNLSLLRKKAGELSRIRIWGPEMIGSSAVYGFDPTKLVISREGCSGGELMRILRERYLLEAELSKDGYVLLFTGIMDTDEGFFRLSSALKELDE